jgi:hypothetical protein
MRITFQMLTASNMFYDITQHQKSKTYIIQITYSDAEAEAEAPEAVVFWWKRKRKRLKICRFRSVSKLVYQFWQIFAN